MVFLFPHYCDQDIQRLSYQSYRVRFQTGIYLTPEGKLISKKQDVCLDEGQPPGQPAGTRTSFPPRDIKQGSEVIKSYLWSSCSKAGRVMQKRKKKQNKGKHAAYRIPVEVTHIKMKRGQQKQVSRARREAALDNPTSSSVL